MRGRTWLPTKSTLISDLVLITLQYFFGFCLVKPERTHLSVDADITNPVKFDSSVKFNCTADSRPAVDEYRFYRDESLLGSNNTGIYHLQLQRSGLYSCVPVNSAGSGEKATLYIDVKGKTFVIDFPQMLVCAGFGYLQPGGYFKNMPFPSYPLPRTKKSLLAKAFI